MSWKRVLELRGWLFILSVVLYLIFAIVPYYPVHLVMSLTSILTLVLAFTAASRTSKGLTAAFLMLGFLLVNQEHLSALKIILSFGSMLQLLSLFSIVPILALPIRLGDYGRSVEHLVASKQISERVMYLLIALLSYILGSLMNIAAIPMMYQSVHRLIEQSHIGEKQKFLTKSIITGYAMPLIWSPIAAVVAAVVNVTNIAWISILPVAFTLSLVGVGLSLILHKFSHQPSTALVRSHGLDRTGGRGVEDAAVISAVLNLEQRVHSLWHILLGILLFILAMMGLQGATHLSMIEIISILAIPFAWGWSALLGQSRGFLRALQNYQISVKNLHNTFSVFTAAGFFVVALQHSHYIKSIDAALVSASSSLSPAVFIACIPVLTILLSLIGFHPVVSITLLGAALRPQVLHMSPLWLSVALLGGGVLTFIVSPFNATLNVTGTVSGQPAATLMRWNLPFVLAFLAMVMLIVAVGQTIQPAIV